MSRQEVGHRATVAQVGLVAGRKNSKFLNFPLVAIAHFIILGAIAASAAIALFCHSECGERQYDPLKFIIYYFFLFYFFYHNPRHDRDARHEKKTC